MFVLFPNGGEGGIFNARTGNQALRPAAVAPVRRTRFSGLSLAKIRSPKGFWRLPRASVARVQIPSKYKKGTPKMGCRRNGIGGILRGNIFWLGFVSRADKPVRQRCEPSPACGVIGHIHPPSGTKRHPENGVPFCGGEGGIFNARTGNQALRPAAVAPVRRTRFSGLSLAKIRSPKGFWRLPRASVARVQIPSKYKKGTPKMGCRRNGIGGILRGNIFWLGFVSRADKPVRQRCEPSPACGVIGHIHPPSGTKRHPENGVPFCGGEGGI